MWVSCWCWASHHILGSLQSTSYFTVCRLQVQMQLYWAEVKVTAGLAPHWGSERDSISLSFLGSGGHVHPCIPIPSLGSSIISYFVLTINHRVSHLQSSRTHRLVLHHWPRKGWGWRGRFFSLVIRTAFLKQLSFVLKKKEGKSQNSGYNTMPWKKKNTSNQPLRSLRACKTHSAYTEWKFSGKPATKSLI